jgi:hypothetical protein
MDHTFGVLPVELPAFLAFESQDHALPLNALSSLLNISFLFDAA